MQPSHQIRRPEDVRTKEQLFPLAKEFIDQYYSSIKRQVYIHGGRNLVAQEPNLASRNVFVWPAKCCLHLKHFKQFHAWIYTLKKLSHFCTEGIHKNVWIEKKLKLKNHLETTSTPSTGESINKMRYFHNEILYSYKKKWMGWHSVCSWEWSSQITWSEKKKGQV